ncbi:MAG TPA: protein-disulfide isomerase [Actinobacteria bacterium]|nr:protein-disulfide isomerase [Actinomycetota bacterium]
MASMTQRAFALTYDYLCPFARIVNETTVEALEAGAPWQVRFRPFSLSQGHVEPGAAPVWDRPAGAPETRGVRALLWSVAVRDRFPDAFGRFHVTLYSARHDEGRDVDDPAVLEDACRAASVDPGVVAELVEEGTPRRTLAREHTEAVERWAIFGVPTIVAADDAVFVRLMERHDVAALERVLDLVHRHEINEFKRTRIPR